MPNLGPNFYPKLVQISSELGMKPEDLIAVMISESGMNPGAVEQKFKGSGLVGFMPDTLKGLGYKGTWEDFSKLSGEDQLDYVKKLVQGYKAGNGGQPFTSAAQYYTANLWPVALKLPGVRQQNPNAAFIENNPETVTDPKTGHKWSKKYYDIGIHISPEMEHNAYKYNPLFDKDKKGAITYGDMMKQVEKNKSTPTYQKAIMAMKDSTGYQAGKGEPSMVASKDTGPKDNDGMKGYMKVHDDKNIWQQLGLSSSPGAAPVASNDYDPLMNQFLQEVAASEKQNKNLYKKFLPVNHMIIKIQAAQYVDAVEFASVLCAALDQELMAQAFTHTDGTQVEVECSIHGPDAACFDAVKQLSNSLGEAFKSATIKIGGLDINTNCVMNKKSSYQQIGLQLANSQHRKFLLKFI